MFLVSGITGNVGGAAARCLLDAKKGVRALVRDPQKAAVWARAGVDLRPGDFNDPAAVAGALDGVEAAFLMLPPVHAPAPGFPEARAMIASYRAALRLAPPPRLVVLSSFGSEQKSGLGLITATHLLEQALDDLTMPIAFVRAGCFMENFVPGLPRVASSGSFDCFLTPADRPVPMTATADIGKEIATLLVEGWRGRKIVELGTRYTPRDVARAMAGVLGRPVEARPIPRDQWPARFEAIGLARGTTAAFEEMWDGVNSGWIDFGVPGTEPVAGTTAPAEVFAKARGA